MRWISPATRIGVGLNELLGLTPYRSQDMNNDFFVMLSTQSGGATPMTGDDDEVAFYPTEDAARQDAAANPLGAHFGYEIFQLGTGET